MKPSRTQPWTVVLTLALGALGISTAHATSFSVTNLNDSGAGSLRQAITDANAAATADSIGFSVSGTILLGSTLPTITDAAGLTMDGAGQTLIISGNNAVRVLQVAINASLTVRNLTIANGRAFGDFGGGIENNGVTTIVNSTFSGNSAASGYGGAIYNGANSAVTITNSTFSANDATSGFGASVYNTGTSVIITDSTFSGNVVTSGLGGGIYNNNLSGVTVRNSIIANSVSAANCGGPITNGGNNIDSAASCGWGSANGSMSSTNPLLGALASNGGPTQTFALLTGSPAIDAATFNAPNGAPSTDQRGTARPAGPAYDIGAFEFTTLALVNAVSRRVHGGAGTFDLTLSAVPTDPTTEPRQGPAQTIVFTFDKPINAATATITEGVATAAAPTFSGNNVVVGLTGVGDHQYVTVALTNVASTDGSSGGSGSVRVGFLAGDVNQNRVVTVGDLGLVNAQLAQPVTAANFLKDVNASGTLSLADKGITNANLAKALPAP